MKPRKNANENKHPHTRKKGPGRYHKQGLARPRKQSNYPKR